MTLKKTDLSYRADIDRFCAYVSLKECDNLIEGFWSSAQLITSLTWQKDQICGDDFLVGLTGSIGRREAHPEYADYDVITITADKLLRDAALTHLIKSNPNPNPPVRFDRCDLFNGQEDPSLELIKKRDFYYPTIDPTKLLEPSSIHERIWLLTEFIPLVESRIYGKIQKELVEYYRLFSHSSLYAKPEKLLADLIAYPMALALALQDSEEMEAGEIGGFTRHAKTIILRKLAHLFNILAVVRLICRKKHIASCANEEQKNHEFFVNMRAPTLIRVGYWFSEEFHYDKPMRRFESEKDTSASMEVYERYLEFLKNASPNGRGQVIYKLCQPIPSERGIVRRLLKRTCVELIENYNLSIKRIWTWQVRDHLSKVSPGASLVLKAEPEFDNIKELSKRVWWPLFALSNLLSITFEVAGEWGYFDDETYPASGRAAATSCLVDETGKMLKSLN
ncbi:UNVERIFIED_ORG: hypothetical protein ABIC54_006402 [Burkholderia sp. 1263]